MYGHGYNSRVDERVVERSVVSKQHIRCVHLNNTTGVHDDDAVGVGNGVEAMSDRDDGEVSELSPNRLLQDGVRLLVDRRRRFVDAQHLQTHKSTLGDNE